MTPKHVFEELIRLLEEDNDATFEVTPAQRTHGEALIATMQANGWDPEGVTPGLDPDYQYVNDMEVFTQGEYLDIIKVAERWGGQELDKLLNQIFGEDQ